MGTVIDIKSQFLKTQIRVLSTSLAPSAEWRTRRESQDNLSDDVVRDVLQKLNSILRQHNRSVYSSAAVRHIAEQIDRLYWNTAEPDEADHDPDAVPRSTDFHNAMSLEVLPETFPEIERAPRTSGLESFALASQYTQTKTKLEQLHERRAAAQKYLDQVRAFAALIKGFENPVKNIQPNLATRDGELQKELQRMKILMARVGQKVQSLTTSNARDETGNDLVEELPPHQRVDALLNNR